MAAIDEIRKRIAESGLKSPTIEVKTGYQIRRATIEKIVTGKTQNPGIDTVTIIGDALGLSVAQMIGEKDPPAEIGRAPCKTWEELCSCLKDMGLDDTQAEIAIAAIQGIIEKTSKGPGKRKAAAG